MMTKVDHCFGKMALLGNECPVSSFPLMSHWLKQGHVLSPTPIMTKFLSQGKEPP